MRITFLLPAYPKRPIGGFRVVYEYANHLVRRGHAVTVVHTSQRRRPGRRLSRNPYRVLHRAAGQARDLLVHPAVGWHDVDIGVRLRYVPSLDVTNIPDGDVIFATAWWTATYVDSYPASKGAKFYLIQHFETFEGSESEVAASWRLPLHKIVIAGWLYDKGIELGVDPSSMQLIPNGIDQQRFRLLAPIEGRPPRVAMLYHPSEWKGSADGIQALAIAKQHVDGLQAALFGVVPRPASLPDWIDYVHDPAQDTLVERIYNQSRVYLCPSWMEGWHLPPAEALACGCALVSTDIPGVRDYAVDGKTALLAQPRHPDQLADRLISLLIDPSKAAELACNGHAHVQRFTWERATDLLEEEIEKVGSPAAAGIRS